METAKNIDQTHTASQAESMIRGISNANNKTTDFEVVIEEIDKDLSDTQPSSNPTVAEIMHEIKGRSLEENKHGNPTYMGKGFEEHLNAQITQISGSQNKEAELMGFTMGWKATEENRKGTKSGKGKPSKILGEKGKKSTALTFSKQIEEGEEKEAVPFRVYVCLEECRTKLEAWNKTEFGYVGVKIAQL
nr:hypothetical protein CFP56_41660 [Quercus suber]